MAWPAGLAISHPVIIGKWKKTKGKHIQNSVYGCSVHLIFRKEQDGLSVRLYEYKFYLDRYYVKIFKWVFFWDSEWEWNIYIGRIYINNFNWVIRSGRFRVLWRIMLHINISGWSLVVPKREHFHRDDAIGGLVTCSSWRVYSEQCPKSWIMQR